MSAITGIFYRDGRKVDPELIKKMNDRLSHRGPDGSDTWCEGSVALGHQMLWTTPESLHEKLPFEESDLVITADARIDNRKELSEELDIEDKEDISDSYFILKSYEKWGEKCPEHLLGDFAFAIWDKNKEKLFCARDHMGVKPFYYYLDDEMFVFGTEIKALKCIGEIPFDINEVKIADYLVSNFEDQEITFFKDILRLPAAHQFIVKPEKTEMDKYWLMDIKKENYMYSDEYVKEFLKIFYEAVNCRLRSAFPVGSFLSGGLDSSSITCTAEKILSKNNSNLITFSIVFNSLAECDESYFIKAVLKEGNFDPFFINGDEISPLNEIDRVIWQGDGPVNAAGYSPFWEIYKIARKKGVRIILDGYGGDDVVSYGAELLAELAISGKWMDLIKEIGMVSHISNRKKWKVFGENVVIPFSPKPIRNIWQYLIPNAGLFSEINMQKKLIGKILNHGFLEDTGIDKRCEHRFERLTGTLQKPEDNHYTNLDFGSYQSMFEGMDQRSAAFSLTMYYPFFDKRLVEFCLSLPYEQILADGFERMILRRSMEGILPEEVQWRKFKTSIGQNFDLGLLKFEKERIANVFSDKSIIGDYVNINALNELYSQYKKGKIDYVLDTPYLLWKAINLEIWLNNENINNN